MSVTVCREWPFKQVWFEAWPEDSERWSRGDRNGKSVPEATVDHWEGTVADGTVSWHVLGVTRHLVSEMWQFDHIRPFDISSVSVALEGTESILQTGHYRLPVVARRNAIVPRGRLPAYRWLRTALSSLGWRQCPHCSANQHSAWRQELFGGGPESM